LDLRWKDIRGDWRKFHNEELHDLYFSPNIIFMIKSRMIQCVGYVAHMGEKRNGYKVLVEKPKGKTLLERPRY
jgi:hypothetical protein